MMDNDINWTVNNQRYHLESDVGYYISGLKGYGPVEREEMYRAEMIDIMVDERLKKEKRRHKEMDY